VFLVAPGTELAAVSVLLLDDAGESAQATAMSVLIIGVGLLVRLVYWILLRGITRRTQAWTVATAQPTARPRSQP
jgi:iron(III) transport system permease protein